MLLGDAEGKGGNREIVGLATGTGGETELVETSREGVEVEALAAETDIEGAEVELAKEVVDVAADDVAVNGHSGRILFVMVEVGERLGGEGTSGGEGEPMETGLILVLTSDVEIAVGRVGKVGIEVGAVGVREKGVEEEEAMTTGKPVTIGTAAVDSDMIELETVEEVVAASNDDDDVPVPVPVPIPVPVKRFLLFKTINPGR